MKNKVPKKKKPTKEMSAEWDLSEGFGGIPEDVDFTKNIGCVSNSIKKKPSTRNMH